MSIKLQNVETNIYMEGGEIGLFMKLAPKVFIILFSYSLTEQFWGL